MLKGGVVCLQVFQIVPFIIVNLRMVKKLVFLEYFYRYLSFP